MPLRYGHADASPRLGVRLAAHHRQQGQLAAPHMNKREFVSTALLSAVAVALPSLPSLPADAKQATRTAGDFCPKSATKDVRG